MSFAKYFLQKDRSTHASHNILNVFQILIADLADCVFVTIDYIFVPTDWVNTTNNFVLVTPYVRLVPFKIVHQSVDFVITPHYFVLIIRYLV